MNWLHKFLRHTGFDLTTRNPALVQAEHVSGYLSCLCVERSERLSGVHHFLRIRTW